MKLKNTTILHSFYVSAVSLLVCLLALNNAWGQSEEFHSIHAPSSIVDKIDPERLLNELRDLSSPAFYGRELGTPGNAKATDWLVHKFNTYGLEPINNSYKQSFPVASYTLGPKNMLHYADSSLQLHHQFVPAYYSASDSVQVLGIYVGEGDNQAYNTLDISGKIAIILQQEPTNGINPFPTYIDQARLAESFGAKGVILISPPGHITPHSPTGSPYRFETDINIPLKSKKLLSNTPFAFIQPNSLSIPVVFASAELLNILFMKYNKDKKIPLGTRTADNILMITNTKIAERRHAYNVMGLWRGTERPTTRRTLIVGTHFDQQGLHPKSGIPFFGANRNAASVSALLEIIRVITETDSRPKHNILFVGWNGTERNLAGIQHFLQNPVIKPNDIMGILNFNEIAGNRNMDSVKVYYAASPDTTYLTHILNNTSRLYNFELSSNRPETNDLHYYQLKAFASNNFPALSINGGYYSLSNRIIDSPDKLNYTQFYNMTRYILDISWGITHLTSF